jgi:hypothetical protein
MVIDNQFLEKIFPNELVEFFEISNYQEMCSVEDKLEYILIDFTERNNLPNGLSFDEYETKDFMASKLIQDFPIRGKGVYLRIKKRRWRHKQTGAIIKRDYSFMAEGSKFTSELSAFLKDTSGYATRYHEQYSQLLSSEEQNSSKAL